MRGTATAGGGRGVVAWALALLATPLVLLGQEAPRTTRADAVAAALARGPRVAIARADSGAAAALVSLARQFDNPALGVEHTGDTPHQHVTLDVPVDLPWLRSARIGVAQAAFLAAGQRFALERAAVAFDADTTYTRAQVAVARRELSTASARDADSLLTLARLRRDAGDASEFDVELATVVAGQLAGVAAGDSLEAAGLLLTLQALMGRASDSVTIALADSLALDARDVPATGATPLLLRAAEQDLDAARLAVIAERRRLYGGTSVSLGFETRDPGGTGNKMLPLVGLSMPLPLFNRNRAAVEFAEAQRQRAQGAVWLARAELAAATARARRGLAVALGRTERSARLQGSADRVASLSLVAYREGAATLPSVIEAQRAAREARSQYLEDVATARIAAGLVHLLTFSGSSPDR